MEIFPSLISSDILNLEKTIKLFNKHCDGYHIDIMDDHFVPNLTWGPVFVNAIISKTNLPINVHLMVDNPKVWLDRINLRKNDVFVFHFESFQNFDDILDFIKNIKKKKIKIGLAINPKTSIDSIFQFLKILDYVLIMSVEPGFSGQKFITKVIDKINKILNKKMELNLKFKIGIDGGIDQNNIKKLTDLGIDQFCVASAIFSQKEPVKALKKLYQK